MPEPSTYELPDSSTSAIATSFSVDFNGSSNEALFQNLSAEEITLSESLLTPGLQTSIKLHSYIHNPQTKVLDNFKSAVADISVSRPILNEFSMPSFMGVTSRIYRLDNRKPISNNIEEFTLHGCDDTLLSDARNLVSKSWKCVTPSSIVDEILRSCVGAKTVDVEGSGPARDYIAENIHPYQVISQQSDVALSLTNSDPSFIHYMTYENFTVGDPRGTHHFRSLASLTAGSPVAKFFTQETAYNSGYGNPESILSYSFPCDFDYLSDILNGLDIDGSLKSSLVIINPMLKSFSLLGDKAGVPAASACGVGGGKYMTAFTNNNSAQDQDSCNSDVEKHLLLRQARMALLEEDKISLRLTVPWNPVLHAGKLIEVNFVNKLTGQYDNYGTGVYLIHSLTHTIKNGGYATTTMDCVAQSVGGGIV